MSETISIPGTDETITVEGRSETLTLAREDEDRVLTLSFPGYALHTCTTEIILVFQPYAELLIASCGSQGPPGPPGPPSTGQTYVHDQAAPSTMWVITHNLGQYPSVTVVDSGGNEVDGDVQYISDDLIHLFFNVPFGGKAYLN